jgi:hypothetical protein
MMRVTILTAAQSPKRRRAKQSDCVVILPIPSPPAALHIRAPARALVIDPLGYLVARAISDLIRIASTLNHQECFAHPRSTF